MATGPGMFSANSDENHATQPRWVRERRYGIHGIDHMETGAFDKDPVPSFDDLYWRFCETVHGLDENIGRVLDYLDESGLAKNTIVLYLGDNGFALGEHGFYDKRDAFEESIRTDRYKYIYYYGLWDKNGFYDLQTDPHERHNLIDVPAFAEQVAKLKKQMFDELEASGGLEIPVRRPRGEPLHDRKLRR